MGARWYDPNTAIFRTRDTVFGMLGTPVTLNRYTYAGNNPTKYWDPTGHDFSDIFFGDFFSYADMIELMPQYAPPPPQEPITETFASGTGAWTTITTDQWGNTTFIVTAATGITISAPSTTERSGNLSYTPTAAAHVAAVTLADQGVGAGAIAGAIDDAVALVGSSASTAQIESAAYGQLTPPPVATSKTESSDPPQLPSGVQGYSSGAISIVGPDSLFRDRPNPKPTPRPPGKLGNAITAAVVALGAACASSKVDCTPKPAPGGGRGATTTIPSTDSCGPEDDRGYDLYHGTDSKSARNIAKSGLNRAALDQFGGDRNFYVSSDICDAEVFANVAPGVPDNAPSVVGFRLAGGLRDAIQKGIVKVFEGLPNAYTVNVKNFDAFNKIAEIVNLGRIG